MAYNTTRWNENNQSYSKNRFKKSADFTNEFLNIPYVSDIIKRNMLRDTRL